MINLSLDEMLELAREAALQRRLEEDGVGPTGPTPVQMPEDLRGKLRIAPEAGEDDPPADPSERGLGG